MLEAFGITVGIVLGLGLGLFLLAMLFITLGAWVDSR